MISRAKTYCRIGFGCSGTLMMELSNIEVRSVCVYVSVMEQIHRQLKDVPPGTKITGVRIG
jgi:hypothetical protein